MNWSTPLKHVHVQNATSPVLMFKIWQCFRNVVDVMASYIPWANMREYIERMKINKDTPCQFIRCKYDQLEIDLKRPTIDSHLGHHW
jgi:hypothetical protein